MPQRPAENNGKLRPPKPSFCLAEPTRSAPLYAMRRFRLLPSGLTVALLLVSCSTPPSGEHAGLNPDQVGLIKTPLITEASGLATSRRAPGVYWTHNDSGGVPVLYAIDEAGTLLGAVRINGVENHDWEDIASFTLDGRPYLLAADVGDNRAVRTNCAMYIIPEPDPATLQPDRERHEDVAWQIPVRYPDGPRDCESVAVDVPGKQIYLISKRTKPPVVYRLPLRPVQTLVPLVAERVGTMPGIPAANPVELLRNPYRNQPTGFDLTPDGRTAAVVTYGAVYLFHRQPGATWAATLEGAPEVLPDHHLRQAEDVCFTPDGRSILVTTEGSPAPLLRYRLDRQP